MDDKDVDLLVLLESMLNDEKIKGLLEFVSVGIGARERVAEIKEAIYGTADDDFDIVSPLVLSAEYALWTANYGSSVDCSIQETIETFGEHYARAGAEACPNLVAALCMTYIAALQSCRGNVLETNSMIRMSIYNILKIEKRLTETITMNIMFFESVASTFKDLDKNCYVDLSDRLRELWRDKFRARVNDGARKLVDEFLEPREVPIRSAIIAIGSLISLSNLYGISLEAHDIEDIAMQAGDSEIGCDYLGDASQIFLEGLVKKLRNNGN